jgi:hypothetical protein
MTSRKQFLLRINSELYQAIEVWAHQELRSVNGQIEYILKDAVSKRQKAIENVSLEDKPVDSPAKDDA